MCPDESRYLRNARDGSEHGQLQEFLKRASALESAHLELAIVEKSDSIRELSNLVNCWDDSVGFSLDPIDFEVVASKRACLGRRYSGLVKEMNNHFSHWPVKARPVHRPGTNHEVSGSGSNVSPRTLRNRKKRLYRDRNKLRKQAAEGLNSGAVINLTADELPPEVVVVLMKRSGFVPDAPYDSLRSRSDCYNAMCKLAVKTKQKMKPDTDEPASQVDGFASDASLPPSLYRRRVGYPPMTGDVIVDSVVSEVQELVLNINPHKKPSNLSSLELEGLDWIQHRVRNHELVVCQADKGGALILAPYEHVQSLVLDKLTDESLYECKGPEDCSPKYCQDLYKLWSYGMKHDFVSPHFGKEVVGVSPDGRPSTAGVFKPGMPYFYPLLKVHKLKPQELKFGCRPPVRLVANLSDSVTSRSDKFLAWNFLKPLQNEFCKDLLGDSSQLLQWLEGYDGKDLGDRRIRGFALDFDSLYDSLRPSLVIEAVRSAITECDCSANWSTDMVSWLCKLINLSFESSVAKFGDNWYRSRNGIPTGNSLSVMLANITVYYVLKKVIYSDENIPPQLIDLRRFIDDLGGMWSGTVEQFGVWADGVNRILERDYGLSLKRDHTKPWDISGADEFATFLDVRFKFDAETRLITDVNIKDTDARVYLHFSSCHPRHVFNSVVYSQALRYRRIINNDDTLKLRFAELKEAFKKSGYPEGLLKGIFDDVSQRQRSLERRSKTLSCPFDVPWVATFGAGTPEISKIISETNKILKKSPVWKDVPRTIGLVNRRGRTIGDIVLSRKRFALGRAVNNGATTRCTPLDTRRRGAPCLSCNMMSGVSTIKSHARGTCYRTGGGNCKSRNIVYSAQCTECCLQYVGQTTQELRARISGHRVHCKDRASDFVRCRETRDPGDLNNDGVALVDHMWSVHGKHSKEHFASMYRFSVCAADVSPRSLDSVEQAWVAKLRTMRPEGINIANPGRVRQGLVTRVLRSL